MCLECDVMHGLLYAVFMWEGVHGGRNMSICIDGERWCMCEVR